jgi:di/tricarboxylate transporter
MVQEPGQYEFIDYVKLGLPLTVVVGVVVVILTPLIHPF